MPNLHCKLTFSGYIKAAGIHNSVEMIEYKRITISDQYFAVQIFECPLDVILFAAGLGSENVTIENHSHFKNPNSLTINIKHDTLTIQPKLNYFFVDFQISKSEFLILKDMWDTQGCYAIFHESERLKFKATDLSEHSRYKALDNFKWTLEIGIPDSASDGWGQIVSPNLHIIDEIEQYIKGLH